MGEEGADAVLDVGIVGGQLAQGFDTAQNGESIQVFRICVPDV